VPAQLLVAAGAIVPGTARFERLELCLDAPFTRNEFGALVKAGGRLFGREVGTTPQGAQQVAREEAEAALRGLSCEGALSEPPTWGEVCGALLLARSKPGKA